MEKTWCLRRLPLAGTRNTRDLGGYPTLDGGATRWGVFLRSDSPHQLTEADLAALRAYGMTDAVDLRRPNESEAQPSPFETAPGFIAHSVSLADGINSSNYEGDLPGSMSGLYIMLLDNSAEDLARVVKICAEAEGGVLFHCAVGKDRTGVVAMLLLLVAGVAEPDIVADYAVTEVYMKEFIDERARLHGVTDIPEHILRSMPDSMWRVLAHLKERYGTVEDYLRKAGLDDEVLGMIRRKFVLR